MSIQSEITRISDNVSDALDSVAAKGVTVPSGSNSDDLADLIDAIPSGGASNFVTGTFTCNNYGSTGTQTIDVSYSGSGYPISMNIYPVEGGYNSSSYYYDLVQRYGIIFYNWVKSNVTTEPTYSGSGAANQGSWVRRYKSSNSSATTYAHSSVNNNSVMFSETTAPNGNICVIMSGNKQFKIKIVSASGYGFIPSQQYRYELVYSG